MIIQQRDARSFTYPCASFNFPIENNWMQYQSRLFWTDFILILYKKVIFKNGLETCHPYSNTSLLCVHSDNSLRRPFWNRKNALQNITFEDLDHASEF